MSMTAIVILSAVTGAILALVWLGSKLDGWR